MGPQLPNIGRKSILEGRERGVRSKSPHRGSVSGGGDNRREEPKEVEREGFSLEWGTQNAPQGLKGFPDLIYDEGDVGKEPMIRVLGRNPMEVVDKVIRIAKTSGFLRG